MLDAVTDWDAEKVSPFWRESCTQLIKAILYLGDFEWEMEQNRANAGVIRADITLNVYPPAPLYILLMLVVQPLPPLSETQWRVKKTVQLACVHQK